MGYRVMRCVEEREAGGEAIEKARRGTDSLGMARFCRRGALGHGPKRNTKARFSRRGIEWSGESRTAWMAG